MGLNLNEVTEVKEANTIEQANTLLDEGWTLLSTRISEYIRFNQVPVGGSVPYKETQFIYLLGREKPFDGNLKVTFEGMSEAEVEECSK